MSTVQQKFTEKKCYISPHVILQCKHNFYLHLEAYGKNCWTGVILTFSVKAFSIPKY